jgi:PAS domain S-box-containing protein
MFPRASLFKRPSVILFVAGTAGAFALLYFTIRLPPIPRGPLRIGFEQNPPVQIRTDSGFSGLAVETVNEAAKRAGLRLQWVETGTSSDEAFQKGTVDLWPLMADLPDRRKRLHMSRPWLHSNHVLLLRADAQSLDRGFSGRIGLVKMPLHVRLARELYPKAQLAQFPDSEEVVSQVCTGASAGGFLEGRVAATALRDKPAECASVALRFQVLPATTIEAGVASTFEAAGAADAIRRQMGTMFRDGTLAVLMAKYSYYGLDDAWSTYDLMEAAERSRWVAWGIGAVAGALVLALWRASASRQRKRSEAALRESEERFRRVFEEGPLGLALVGRDYHFLKVNSALCQMVGYSEAELLRMSLADVTHPDDLGANAELGEKLFKREIPSYQLQRRYVRKDDEVIWINLTASLIRDQQGEPLYGLAMIEDITNVKRTQEEAVARQKLEGLGVLAGGIAHDFNNLLGGILAEAELTEADLPVESPALDEIQRIKQSALRGSEIVRELMIYAGHDQRAISEALDLSSLVTEMLTLLKFSISKHAVLRTDLGDNLPPVGGNAAQIRQVVMNLVINASEAIGEKEGVIHVTTARLNNSGNLASNSAMVLPPGDYVQLEVSDTGCGMTELLKAKIFDPFFSTKFVGRGLGLAVVQGILRGQGGAIDVVSSPGEGTTFKVFLPCAPEGSARLTSAPSSFSVAQAKARTGTILVVEDEQILRSAVSKALRKSGFVVMEATDGSAAIELLRTHEDRIDAVLLDFTLPGISSREVFEETQRMRPELKVIVTSAYSKDTVDASFTGLKVEHFIRKPFQLGEIAQLLGEVLSVQPNSLPAVSELRKFRKWYGSAIP